MYQHNQMYGQLPYSPQQIQVQMVQQPVIPNIGLPPHLSSYANMIPMVATCLIQELQGRAQTPLRIFLLNQVGQNGFQNNEFAALVNSTIEYIGYMVRNGMAMGPQQLVQQACSKMIMFIAAHNVQVFPPLQSYADQNVAMALQEYNAIGQNLLRERQQQQNTMYPGVNQQWNSMPGNGGGVNFSNAHGGMQRNFGNTGQSGLFTSGNGNMDMGVTNTMDRNFGGNITGTVTQATETFAQEAVVDKLEANDVATSLEAANAAWFPSEGTFYRPAYEPSHQKLTVSLKNGRYYYQVKELGDDEMDPNKPRLTPLFKHSGMIAEKLRGSNESANVELAEAVSDAKSATSGADITLDTYSRIQLDRLPIELGYESVWVSGIVERVRRQRERTDAYSDKPINIIQWHSGVVTPVVINNPEEADLIRRFADMDCHQLLMNIAHCKDKFSVSTLAVIDERLTAETNKALRVNLSIPNISISSFVDDWNDLVNHIANKYGEAVAARLVSMDVEIIKAALSMVSEDCAQEVTSGIYDTNDGESYPVSYFIENVSFTMLEFLSNELDLDFVSDTSALLSKVNTRVWYDLADQIFREFGDVCKRHLVRTFDGKVLEISKGWLTDNAYIISIVS